MKPVVHYDAIANPPVVGSSVLVVVLDHPNFPPDHPVWTSKVEQYDPTTGVFETKNTIYKPHRRGSECCGGCC